MSEETITIDITPTWAGILPVLVNTFNNSKGSRDELYRLAEFADKTLPAAMQRVKELEGLLRSHPELPDDWSYDNPAAVEAFEGALLHWKQRVLYALYPMIPVGEEP
jgi:hypothetical protein